MFIQHIPLDIFYLSRTREPVVAPGPLTPSEENLSKIIWMHNSYI